MTFGADLQQQKHSRWLNFERRNWAAGVALAGCLGFAWGNGHTTQGAVAHIAKQLGDTKKVARVVATEAKCEHLRANLATGVAGQAIAAAQLPAVPSPSLDDLPGDNCPHAGAAAVAAATK